MWDSLLDYTNHRPWPLPSAKYAMTMTWQHLLFAHWRVPAGIIRPLIPATLELETFDGDAWIGVVPFQMRNVGPRSFPRIPWLSSFLELNVRTYVNRGGRPGVFFFSLDAANPVAVQIARWWYHLPYFNARMRMQRSDHHVQYLSIRTQPEFPPGVFQGRYGPAGPVYQSKPGTLDHWLTERYCLYAVDRNGVAYRGEIHHRPWPLQPAEAKIDVNSVVDAHGFRLPDEPPLLHFVESIDVLAWNPYRV